MLEELIDRRTSDGDLDNRLSTDAGTTPGMAAGIKRFAFGINPLGFHRGPNAPHLSLGQELHIIWTCTIPIETECERMIELIETEMVATPMVGTIQKRTINC